jgi:hypothetical protein
MNNKTLLIEIENQFLMLPITNVITEKSIELLNIVFNLSEFKEQLVSQSFFCGNKLDLCINGKEITGLSVYEDFIGKGKIKINLTVKSLINPWKRYVSGTLGETNPNGNSIVSYTWWLNEKKGKDLIIAYATHVGHEIFHTKYFQYIHDPKYGSRNFDTNKDVTYKIDEILEHLIMNHYQ